MSNAIPSTTSSPKRKRSTSPTPDPDPNTQLQYAYDDGDEDRNPFSTSHSPPSSAEDTPSGTKRRKITATRPRRLNYQPHLTLHGHKRGISAIKISPSGALIASASADATIKIWSSTTGRLQQTLEGHLAGVNAIAWSPDSRILASGSDDKLIRLWDVESGRCVSQPLVGHHNYVYSLAFSPKGNMLVSGSYDEAVFLWDVRTARLMRSLPAHSDPVSGVDFVRDGTLIASCSTDGLIRIWDTGTGQCLKTLVHEDNAAVTSVRFSPNGKYVLAATLDNCVRLWNYVEGRCVKTYQGHRNERFSINACFGTYTAEVGKQAGDESDGHSPHENGDAGSVQQTWAFALTGSECASAEDTALILWDVSSKEVLQKLKGHVEPVLSVDVGMEDQTIVSGGLDRVVRVWKRVPTPEGLAGGDEEEHEPEVGGQPMPLAVPVPMEVEHESPMPEEG